MLPLQVFLRAFLLGIFDTRIALDTVEVLQWLLRADPRIKQLRHAQMGQIVLDLICYCACDPEIGMAHIQTFLQARESRLLTPMAALRWRYLLHVEYCIINRCGLSGLLPFW